jgi:hypothetical protein
MPRATSLAALLLALALSAGCSDLGAPLKPNPQAALSVTALDFGTVALSQTRDRSVTLSNAGTGTLTGTVAVSCAAYTIESGGGAYSLAAGESRTIDVRFNPGTVGDFSCELTLGDAAPPIPLSGSGALQNPGARAIVLPDSLPFGAVRLGQTANRAFELLNAGTTPLLVNVASASSDFEVVVGGGGREIAAGTSITVVVSFHPSIGGPLSAALELGPACPQVGVSGLGISISFATDLQPIFTARCGNCHEFGMPQFYDTYMTLVTWYQGSPQGRIKPYDLENSYLYQKIIGNPAWGDRMPQGGPYLSDTDIAKVREWILEGALEN